MPSEPLLPLQQQKILGRGEGTCLRHAQVKMSWSEKNTLAGFTLANLETSLKVSTVIISFDKCKSVRQC